MIFSIFDKNGAYAGQIKDAKVNQDELPPGCIATEGRFDHSHFYSYGTESVGQRMVLELEPPASITANGTDAATIANIPQGVTVSLNGADPVPVTDGEIKFKTLDAGDHSLVFSGIKYLPQELTIGAV